MRRLRSLWESMFGEVDRRVRAGKILGLLFIAAGFVVMGFAWNGAAELVRVDSQMPYLLSGGFIGVGLVVTGSVLLLLATVRGERQIMSDKFDQVTTLLGRNLNRLQMSANGAGATNSQVVAGSSAYHMADCKVLEGKKGLMTITVEQAVAEGLSACRVCNPPQPREEEAAEERADSGEKVASEA